MIQAGVRLVFLTYSEFNCQIASYFNKSQKIAKEYKLSVYPRASIELIMNWLNIFGH